MNFVDPSGFMETGSPNEGPDVSIQGGTYLFGQEYIYGPSSGSIFYSQDALINTCGNSSWYPAQYGYASSDGHIVVQEGGGSPSAVEQARSTPADIGGAASEASGATVESGGPSSDSGAFISRAGDGSGVRYADSLLPVASSSVYDPSAVNRNVALIQSLTKGSAQQQSLSQQRQAFTYMSLGMTAASALVIAGSLMLPAAEGALANLLPGQLGLELASAAEVGAVPIETGTAAFEAAVNQGTIK
ncbi:MAG: hypothetical protein QM784_23005 [Polyangiaceae bacterium]